MGKTKAPTVYSSPTAWGNTQHALHPFANGGHHPFRIVLHLHDGPAPEEWCISDYSAESDTARTFRDAEEAFAWLLAGEVDRAG